MPTEDAYSSGHLVLSHFGTCKCSNVETNLSWTCLVSGLLSLKHPSVLLFFAYYSEHLTHHIWNLQCSSCGDYFVTGDLACISDQRLRSHFKKWPKYRVLSRTDFTKCRSIVEEAHQTYWKQWCKKKCVRVHALNNRKNKFLRIVDIRIEHFITVQHLYKQPPSRSVKALKSIKKENEKKHSKYVLCPCRQSSK